MVGRRSSGACVGKESGTRRRMCEAGAQASAWRRVCKRGERKMYMLVCGKGRGSGKIGNRGRKVALGR